MKGRLAIDGGEPVRTKPFPSRAVGFGGHLGTRITRSAAPARRGG